MSSNLDARVYGELRIEFIDESLDNLEDMEEALNNFSAHKTNASDVLILLRQKTHTIKGLAHPFGFSLLESVAHQFESFMLQGLLFSAAEFRALQIFIDTMKECLLQIDNLAPEIQVELLENLPKAKPSPARSPTAEAPVNILIITSSRTVYKKVSGELRSVGFHIDRASNSVLGIEHTVKSQPDVVIVSDILDSMSGVDLIHAFVAMPITRNIPVILMTSFDEQNPELKKLPSYVPIIFLGSNIEDEILSALTGIEHRFIQPK